MTTAALRWHVHTNATRLAVALAEEITYQAAEAIQRRGVFRLVLAGGSTPRGIYQRLATQPADWNHWAIYFGDERCLPAGHEQRNDVMVQRAWLEQVAIPPHNVHRIAAELGAQPGAAQYCETLAGLGPFDRVLLGLGEDGHTASLFPGGRMGSAVNSPDALPVLAAPKPPVERISLSSHRLSRTRRLSFIATGPAKRVALAQLAGGADIPAAAVRPTAGVDVHTDQDLTAS